MSPALALKRVAPWIDERVWWAALTLVGFALLTSRRLPLPTPIIWIGLAAGLLALVVIGYVHPEIPLYVLAAYVPFSHLVEGKLGGATSVVSLTTLLMLAVAVPLAERAFVLGERRWISAPLTWAIGLLALCAIGSLALTGWRYGGWYVANHTVLLVHWLMPLGFYALTLAVVRDVRTLKTVLALMLAAVILVALLALRESMGRHGSLNHSRVGGISNHPNLLGAFFVYYMFIFLGFVLVAPNRLRAWGWLGAFGLCLRGIMVTFSRGAYLACVTGLLAACGVRSKRLFVAALAIGALALAHPMFIPAGIRYRVHMTVATPSHEFSQKGDITEHLETSAAARVEIWRAAIHVIKDHPWWGVGFGAFPNFLAHYTQGKIGEMNAHNSFLMLAAEMGIVPALVFLVVLGMVSVVAWRVYRRSDDATLRALALGVLAGAPALIVANLFTVCIDAQEVIGYFWIFAALLVRAVWLERTTNAEAHANV